MAFRSLNPSTGRVVAEYPTTSRRELDEALVAAVQAFGEWSRCSFRERAVPLRRAAALLRERSSSLAERMAVEMGKPLADGKAEVEKCAWVCEYYAEHAEGFLADEAAPMEQRVFVTQAPLGPILAIMPWNFPCWQAFRFLAPTLMAGNVGLLKHAENVPGCAEDLIAILRDAGFPGGVFQNLRLSVESVGELIARPEVRAVSLTGSTRAGRAVGAAAGAALKPCVLELGGSDPYVVLGDADLDLAAAKCVSSRLINGGQSCIAAKRFVVVAQVAEAFTERVVLAMKEKRFGDPLGQDPVDLGPMAREDLRAVLHDQVKRSVAAGSRLLLGGQVPGGSGWFYPPTVLADVRPSSPAYSEETFGPVASLIVARDEADALRIANDTSFGLGAAVFTADVERGERIARDVLVAGSCAVNDFVRSDPRVPFGGTRDSGFGRELARQGIQAFVNVKTVWVGR